LSRILVMTVMDFNILLLTLELLIVVIGNDRYVVMTGMW
jgi:hypothetical protein